MYLSMTWITYTINWVHRPLVTRNETTLWYLVGIASSLFSGLSIHCSSTKKLSICNHLFFDPSQVTALGLDFVSTNFNSVPPLCYTCFMSIDAKIWNLKHLFSIFHKGYNMARWNCEIEKQPILDSQWTLDSRKQLSWLANQGCRNVYIHVYNRHAACTIPTGLCRFVLWFLVNIIVQAVTTGL